MLGIIGGSGLYQLVKGEEKTVKTEFGEATAVLARISGKNCAFIARHGKTHSIPPHMINHRANVSALKKLGATDILAISSVGVISDYELGDLIIVRDFISFGPGPTFFDDFSGGIAHTDMTEPYSPELAKSLIEGARNEEIRIQDGGILAHTSGPRFETKAEIKALSKMGANLVGMTSVPEAILANELEIRFANLAIASNYACGISKNPLTVEEVLEIARKKEDDIKRIIRRLTQSPQLP
ncbi:MAG: MTAP family purine nucleoside phosphorylase [Candidatus Micrarchaeota archaeon]